MVSLLLGICTKVNAQTMQTETMVLETEVSISSSFDASQIQLSAKSVAAHYSNHSHDYDANILCYNSSFTKSKTISLNRIYTSGNNSFSSIVMPEVYSDSIYTGRYFKGQQVCNITVSNISKTYSKVIN